MPPLLGDQEDGIAGVQILDRECVELVIRRKRLIQIPDIFQIHGKAERSGIVMGGHNVQQIRLAGLVDEVERQIPLAQVLFNDRA